MTTKMTYTKQQLHEAFSLEHYKRKELERENNILRHHLAHEQSVNKVKKFILKYFDTDVDSVDRCLSKATTIVLEDDMICVMNSEWIYYFGSSRNKRFSRKEYNFYKLFNFSGKKLQANNINAYKNHLKLENNQYFWI